MKRVLWVMLLCAACGGGEEKDNGVTQCSPGETANPVTGACDTASDMGSSEDTGGNVGDDMDETTPDMPADDPDMGGDPVDMNMAPDMNTTMPDMMPGAWPPAIESLHSPGMCNLPACDENGEAGIDTTGMWVTTLTTVESDCSDFIKQQDARANVGNVDVSDPEPLRAYNGECGVNDAMEHITTAMDGIAATCARNDQQFGVVSFETTVVTYNGGTGTGEAFVYLENVPSVVGADCFMRFDVLQERQ